MRKRKKERKHKGKERKEETRASRYRVSSIGHKGYSKDSMIKRELGKKEEKGKVKESLRKHVSKTEKERKKEQKEGKEKRC